MAQKSSVGRAQPAQTIDSLPCPSSCLHSVARPVVRQDARVAPLEGVEPRSGRPGRLGGRIGGGAACQVHALLECRPRALQRLPGAVVLAPRCGWCVGSHGGAQSSSRWPHLLVSRLVSLADGNCQVQPAAAAVGCARANTRTQSAARVLGGRNARAFAFKPQRASGCAWLGAAGLHGPRMIRPEQVSTAPR